MRRISQAVFRRPGTQKENMDEILLDPWVARLPRGGIFLKVEEHSGPHNTKLGISKAAHAYTREQKVPGIYSW